MTKPEDIPQDVWEAAMAALWVTPDADGQVPGYMEAVGRTVSEAIMAAKAEEREATANFIKSLRSNRQQLLLHLGEMTQQEMRTLTAGLQLAEHAIRSRSNTPL